VAGLRQESLRPERRGSMHQRMAVLAREHDHARCRKGAPEAHEGVQTLGIGQIEIEQHQEV
jgi:hypothetical protein